MQIGTVILFAVADGFAIAGTSSKAIEFVSDMKKGYMAEGVRIVTKEECTEDLLRDIESHFNLKLQV